MLKQFYYFLVLNLLIGSSFKSGSVLKRLELKEDSNPRQFFVVEEFKGKSRVVNLKANVEIPTRQDQVMVNQSPVKILFTSLMVNVILGSSTLVFF